MKPVSTFSISGTIKRFALRATHGLVRKLFWLIGTLLVGFIAIVFLINVTAERKALVDRLNARLLHVTQLVADISASYTYELRISDLEIVLQDIQRQPDIEHVRALDSDGRLLASGEIANTMSFLEQDDQFGIDAEPPRGSSIQVEWQDNAVNAVASVMVNGDHLGWVSVGVSLDELHAELGDLIWRNIWLALCFAVFGLTLTLWLSHRLAKPLTDLSAAIQAVADGDIDRRVEIRSNDEIELLAGEFNRMLDDLQGRMQEIRRLAFTDHLTSLPNRNTFKERVAVNMAMAKRHGYRGAVLFLDLDRFKRINDTLGHHVGDELLKAFSLRLQESVRVGDEIGLSSKGHESTIVARLGGDEFTVLLSRIESRSDAELVARRILQRLSEPLKMGNGSVVASTSIGIAVFPDDGNDTQSILKCADAAMYAAKAAGRNQFHFFNRSHTDEISKKLEIENGLRRALAEDEITIALQPQFDSQFGRIIGVEALVRWIDPTLGFVLPGKFLPIAEECGLMPDIARMVLSKAIRWAAKPDIARHGIRIGVNLSSTDLETPDLAGDICDLLDEHGLEATRLELEVTELLAMSDNPAVRQNMESLCSKGVRFAVDDFGIGYSNLSKLKVSYFKTLKIDRSLITEIEHSDDDRALLQLILTMADTLSMEVVAEGVETRGQLDVLRQGKCHLIQGYLFARPMREPDFMTWFAEYQRGEHTIVASTRALEHSH